MAGEFLTAQLVLDRPAVPPVRSDAYEREFASRYAERQVELTRRLAAEPGVSDITFASAVPGIEGTVWVEADGVAAPAAGAAAEGGWVQSGTRAGYEVRLNKVAVNLFDALKVPLLTGRNFTVADAALAANTVTVNQSFVRNVLGSGEALGRRVRYVGASNDTEPGEVELGRWYEIVGVVADFPARPTSAGLADAKMYHAAAPGAVSGATIAMRVRAGAPASFAGRLREISAAVDPSLQLRNVESLDAALRKEQGMTQLLAAVLAVLTVSVLVLSCAEIYALMSFTVGQRRKEIGIRTALGADPRRILRSIFSRALGQLAIGAVLGVMVAALLEAATEGGLMNGHGAVILPVVAVFMVMAGALAAVGPARRGLRIHPTDALREQ